MLIKESSRSVYLIANLTLTLKSKFPKPQILLQFQLQHLPVYQLTKTIRTVIQIFAFQIKAYDNKIYKGGTALYHAICFRKHNGTAA